MCKSCLKVEQRFATPFVVCSVAIAVYFGLLSFMLGSGITTTKRRKIK